MATDNSNGLFRRLTKLFRSGPVIKRKVRDFESSQKSTSAFELFRKNQSNVYSTAMSAYGTYDRMARYSDFSEMEYTPEISSALDIYAEETVASDERGNVLHVYSENPTIKKLLSELFYDTINVEFNLTELWDAIKAVVSNENKTLFSHQKRYKAKCTLWSGFLWLH